MKARIRAVALNVAMVGLALMAPAAAARAAQLVPSSLGRSNVPSTVNVLSTLNGLCPSNFPCASDRLSSFWLQ